MKAVKIILGIILLIGPLVSIPKLLDSGRGLSTLVVPVIVLIIGILLIKSGLSSSKK